MSSKINYKGIIRRAMKREVNRPYNLPKELPKGQIDLESVLRAREYKFPLYENERLARIHHVIINI